MRKAIVFLAVFLVSCTDSYSPSVSVTVIRHRPEITQFSVSPSSAEVMQGGGSVLVTVNLGFRDEGGDVRSLWLTTPEGSLQFGGFPTTQSGTFSVNFEVSTEYYGSKPLTFWLVDEEGLKSISVNETFWVGVEIHTDEWTQRLSGLPGILNDVVWDGEVFVAVGDEGAVFTSSTGIDWISQETSVDSNLLAVAAYESSIVAVGESGTVLLSQDHGETWDVKHGDELIEWHAVVIDASRIVVGGKKAGPDAFHFPISMSSMDGGTSWEDASSLPSTGLWVISDIVSQDGLYVAATQGLWFSPRGNPQVWVSTDAKNWHAIEVGDDESNAALSAIIWDGNRFIVTGTGGGVFMSPDGYNWSRLKTPIKDENLSYLGIAGYGSELLLAGGAEPWGFICGASVDVPAGLASYDGLVTWEVFDIETNYTSYGLARGPDRFVSVGALILNDDNCERTIEGQIYTKN